MVRQFTFNLYFHCCYRCCYMYIVDVKSSDFLFCVLRPAKHTRRWGHNLQEAHFLQCFDRCSDYFTENTSWSCKLCQNNDIYESIRAFPKIQENSDFDHLNYWLFQRIPAVPGTSNNRGLTVYKNDISHDMRFPTMWYVRPAKPQISLLMCAVWPEPLLVAWIFNSCLKSYWLNIIWSF